MPILDENGKPLSGAAQRKRAKAIKEELLKNTRARKAAGKGSVFKDIAPPPLDDTAKATIWMNKVLLTATYGVMQDDEIPFEKQVKYILEAAGKAGMIRDKVSEQEKIDRILEEQEEAKKSQGLQDATQFKPPTISRPPR
jgi:hypothetical protein